MATMTTSERLQAILKYMGMNAKVFSEMCGYDRPQVMYDVIKGKTRNISAAMCDRILNAVPNISRTWLVTGEGTMTGESTPVRSQQIAQNVCKVPLIPVAALAGPIKSYYEPGVELLDCEFVISPSPQAEMAIPISGNSMEPLFADGSVVFVRRINGEAFIPWGHPMVIDTENGVFIKNIMPDTDDDTYVWAESINPKYPPMHIPKTSISGLYRVLQVQKTFATM